MHLFCYLDCAVILTCGLASADCAVISICVGMRSSSLIYVCASVRSRSVIVRIMSGPKTLTYWSTRFGYQCQTDDCGLWKVREVHTFTKGRAYSLRPPVAPICRSNIHTQDAIVEMVYIRRMFETVEVDEYVRQSVVENQLLVHDANI